MEAQSGADTSLGKVRHSVSNGRYPNTVDVGSMQKPTLSGQTELPYPVPAYAPVKSSERMTATYEVWSSEQMSELGRGRIQYVSRLCSNISQCDMGSLTDDKKNNSQ